MTLTELQCEKGRTIMPDIAIGRKEILKALDVSSWRTIMSWKKKDPGFKKLLRVHPISNKPFLIIDELKTWMVEYDKLKKKAGGDPA